MKAYWFKYAESRRTFCSRNLKKSAKMLLCKRSLEHKILHSTHFMIKIHVIIGSTRQQRFSEKPAHWIYEEAKKREGVEVELLDLRDYPLAFFNEPTGPSGMKEEYSDPIARKWVHKIGEADAFVIVTPEYNHGYPAVLKNALDYAYVQWNNKPIGFVSYGGVAGARSVEQLRQVAIELQMAPIQKAVHIPAFWTLMDDQGNFKADTLIDAGGKMLDQLIWWAHALKMARQK